ncbi:MAG: hypothetical protein IH960_09290 [Chloroflexi bacterium]|nr:hypothetical protein [Chloroflexota bacterium]
MYLVFRQFYFGEVLPAPALVKIGSQPLWTLFSFNLDKYAVRTMMPVAFFVTPLLFLPPKSMSRVFQLAFVSILAYFFLFQFFLQTQNDSFRFEYPVVYLAALLGVIALSFADVSRWRDRARFLAPLVGGVLVFLIMTPPSYEIAGAKWHLAAILREYKDDGLVLATTEAGVLPFVSEWKVLDSYGLNDYEIARHGITKSYWSEFAPDVVVNHAGLSWPSQGASGNRLSLYQNMVSSGDYLPVAAIQVRRPFGRDRVGDYQIIFLNTKSQAFEQLSRSITNIDGETYAEIPASFSERFSSVASR